MAHTDVVDFRRSDVPSWRRGVRLRCGAAVSGSAAAPRRAAPLRLRRRGTAAFLRPGSSR